MVNVKTVIEAASVQLRSLSGNSGAGHGGAGDGIYLVEWVNVCLTSALEHWQGGRMRNEE